MTYREHQFAVTYPEGTEADHEKNVHGSGSDFHTVFAHMTKPHPPYEIKSHYLHNFIVTTASYFTRDTKADWCEKLVWGDIFGTATFARRVLLKRLRFQVEMEIPEEIHSDIVATIPITTGFAGPQERHKKFWAILLDKEGGQPYNGTNGTFKWSDVFVEPSSNYWRHDGYPPMKLTPTAENRFQILAFTTVKAQSAELLYALQGHTNQPDFYPLEGTAHQFWYKGPQRLTAMFDIDFEDLPAGGLPLQFQPIALPQKHFNGSVINQLYFVNMDYGNVAAHDSSATMICEGQLVYCENI